MKSGKKVLAVLAVMLLLCQVIGVAAFAAEADPTSVTVSLTSDVKSATENSVYEVALELSEKNVGGVQGVVTYDTELFTFKNVSMTSTMAAVNHLAGADANGLTTAAEVITHDAAKGQIKFVLLADAANADAEWVTFNFTAIEEATQDVTEASFVLSDVIVSNKAGTAAIASVTTTDLKDVVVADTALKMEGASIRTNGEYDLRYELTLPQSFIGSQNVTKIGVVLVPTTLVKDGAQLRNDPTGVSFCKVNNSGVQVVPNIAFLTIDEIKAGQEEGATDYKVYANITKTATSHMNRLYSLRGFAIVEKDGKEYTVYADNDATTVADGTASRSCRGVAISLYEFYTAQGATYEQAVKDIVAKATWTADDYKTVVEANLEAFKNLQ